MFDAYPSRQPIMRTVVRTVPPLEVLMALVVWAGVLSALAVGAEPQPAPAPQFDDIAEAERQAVWNSRAMVSARAWLDEYFRTSREATPEQEQAYRDRLAQLSADEMRTWLRQIAAKRGKTFREHQNEAALRQLRNTQAARQGRLALQTARRPAAPVATFSQPTSLQPVVARRAAEAAYLNQQALSSLRTFTILRFLDTQDIRDDLRELRRRTTP